MQGASSLVGRVLGKGDTVVYESTVYPGATEEICIPILEEHSGLICRGRYEITVTLFTISLRPLNEFKTYGADVDVYDPWVNKDESRQVYGIEPIDVPAAGAYDAVVLCVAHEDFKVKGFAWVASLGKETSVLYDVKNLLPVGLIDGRL